jgi:hypothetical protein
MSEEAVNSPSHYNQTELECIDAIKYALGEEGFIAYCKGNALKYTWRSGHKRDSAEDLKKAAWYCRMASGDDPRKDPGYNKEPKRMDPECAHGLTRCSTCTDWRYVPPKCDRGELECNHPYGNFCTPECDERE